MKGNKIAHKNNSLGKTKSKEKEKEKEEKGTEETYIPPEKKQEIINDLRLF